MCGITEGARHPKAVLKGVIRCRRLKVWDLAAETSQRWVDGEHVDRRHGIVESATVERHRRRGSQMPRSCPTTVYPYRTGAVSSIVYSRPHRGSNCQRFVISSVSQLLPARVQPSVPGLVVDSGDTNTRMYSAQLLERKVTATCMVVSMYVGPRAKKHDGASQRRRDVAHSERGNALDNRGVLSRGEGFVGRSEVALGGSPAGDVLGRHFVEGGGRIGDAVGVSLLARTLKTESRKSWVEIPVSNSVIGLGEKQRWCI